MMRGFAAYLLERFRPRIFGPAILGLAALAISMVNSAPMAVPVARALALTCLLVLQFRLWDDLEDRDRDRRAHPGRVLVRLAPGPFRWAFVALCAANMGVVASVGTPASLMGLFALDLAGLIAYRWLRAQVSDRAWTHWILLAKYPVVVAIVALAIGPVVWQRLAIASVASFAIAQLYERVHTRVSAPGVSR